MIEGSVKWFDPYKGYGFIQYGDDQEVFVHFTGIHQEGFKTLSQDQAVRFKIVEGSRGLQATDVTVIGEDEASFDEDILA